MDPQSIRLIFTLLLVFVAAITGGVVAKRFKQPLLLGYIAAGVIFGNLLPRFIDRSFLQLIADSGVALLLFTLGVEFSFHRLRRTLGAVVWAAVAQILLTIFIFLLVLLV
ncbi:MAG: cation:proton antiporter, partial [Patescibacteria group bacterium]